jgi:4-amino-4-deoxy-L-arabinose transferase-like glycosyltransferase
MKKILTSTLQAEKHLWVWLLWGLALLLLGNASIPFWDQDEAAYAGFAHRMVENGDWLTQEFTWSEIHRKPPWHVWTIAASYSVWGENEFTTRLPVLLATLGLGFLIWGLGRKLLQEKLAAMTVVVLAFSFFVPLLGKIALTDGWLLLWDTLALFALWRVLGEKPGWAALGFWLAIGMGVLTKGPAILLVAGTASLMVLLLHPWRRRIWRLHPWFGLPLALLPLFVWGYLAWQRDDGEMIRWMIDWYILKRTGGTVLGQSGPPGYFLLTLIVAFFPFLRQLPVALAAWWKRVRQREPEALFLLCWMAGAWWIWELIPSKLPAYAIGVHPVIAMLLAREYHDPAIAAPFWYKLGNVLQGLISIVLALGLVGGAIYLLPGTAIAIAVLAAVAVLASWLLPYLRRDHQLRLYQPILIGAFWLLALGGIDALCQRTERCAPETHPGSQSVRSRRNHHRPLQSPGQSAQFTPIPCPSVSPTDRML